MSDEPKKVLVVDEPKPVLVIRVPPPKPRVTWRRADPRAPSKKKAKADECFRCDKKLRSGAGVEGRRGRRYCCEKHRVKAERRECAQCRRDPLGSSTICRNPRGETFCSPVCRTRRQHARTGRR